MSGQSFGRDKRVPDKTAYQRVFDNASSRFSHKNYLILVRRNLGAGARLGLVISKKSVPTAVNRNRIKRMVRESFRLHWPRLPSVDVIFLARPGVNNSTHQLCKQLSGDWTTLAEIFRESGGDDL